MLFVIALGSHYISTAIGARTGTLRSLRLFRHRGGRGIHFLRVYWLRRSFDDCAGSEKSAARPAHWHYRFTAGLHGSVYCGRGDSYRHGAVAEVNIEAPIARAFLDRGLTTASHVITLGALAGLTSVMLVMLLGQTRVLYSMANDGLLPKKILC